MSARKKKEMDSQEVGLVMGLIAARYFFDTDDLHYGYWPDDVEVSKDNIKHAQELHSELILSTIPEGVHTILDVGCGGGALMKRLCDKGYAVEGVSPSGPLTARAREMVGPDGTIIESRFEDVVTDKRYDLILFSESFQYIRPAISLKQVNTLLKPDGHLLICDFFKKPTEEKSPIGGGRRLQPFYDEMARYPFTCLLDRDITKETARNYDLMNEFLEDVATPIWELMFAFLQTRHPRLTRFGRRIFRKKIASLENKYFSGQRTAETFAQYKTYRLMLYQRQPVMLH